MRKWSNFALFFLFVVVIGFFNMKPLLSSTGEEHQEEKSQYDLQLPSPDEIASFGNYQDYDQEENEEEDEGEGEEESESEGDNEDDYEEKYK